MKTKVRKSLKVGLFLLILAGLNFLLARIYETVIMSSSSLILTTDKMLKQVKKGKVEILVLGDSHPWTAINPIYFKRPLITWVSSGEKYHHSYYKLKYFLANCQRPEIVILPLDIHSFTSNFRPEKDDFYWVKYINYLEFGKKRNQFSKFFRKYLKGQFFPYVGESAAIYQWLLKDYLNITKAGFAPTFLTPGKPGNDVTLTERQKTVEQHALNQFYEKNLKRDFFDPLKIYYFNQILTLCGKNNIRVLLVKFPVKFEYYKYVSEHFFSPESYYKRIQSIIPKSCAEFHILDYQDIFFNRPHLMNDLDHVNHDGQKIVSKNINSEIERLLQGKH